MDSRLRRCCSKPLTVGGWLWSEVGWGGGSFPAFVTLVAVYSVMEGVRLGSDVHRSAAMAQRGALQHPPTCLCHTTCKCCTSLAEGASFFLPAEAAQWRSFTDSGLTSIPNALFWRAEKEIERDREVHSTPLTISLPPHLCDSEDKSSDFDFQPHKSFTAYLQSIV